MRFTMHRIGKAAGALALAGGVLVATALPAAAASPNRAYGASATGLISAGPIGQATFPGTSPVTVANANIAPLLTTGIVHDTAGPTTASSTVATPLAGLAKLVSLSATVVMSSCSLNTNTGVVSGRTLITNGRVSGVLPPITLASNPAPNTTVSVPGIATVTLNRQTTAGDGTLTVEAIHVSLLGSTQTLSIGVSVCNAVSLPAPILPGRSAQIALGAVVLLALFGLGYRISTRRRRSATA